MTSLITFLGRSPKRDGEYRTTRYRFPDGSRSDPVAFLGWELARRTEADHVLVLGTRGSMWDNLMLQDFDIEGGDALYDRLEKAVEQKAVDQDMLHDLEPLLARQLGIDISLRIIPYAVDDAEQVDFLRILSKALPRNRQLELDITHGFRHQPMLALVAGMYLKQVKNIDLHRVWYGSFNEDTREGEVLELSGMLRILDWVGALHSYDKDGDYGVFAPLLGEASELLRQAAFFERSTNPVRARQALTGWASNPERLPAEDPVSDLFRDELLQRIDWYKKPNRAEWEAALAWQHLEKRDFVRAVVFALEAAISQEVIRCRDDVNDYVTRDVARQALKKEQDGFRRLNHVRNGMVHGLLATDRSIQRMLADEQTLYGTLKSLFLSIIGEAP